VDPARTGPTKIEFENEKGDLLAARLDEPDGETRAYALFAHCFTCSKDILAASRVSQGLVERGLGVLRFDFTGLGSSEGEFGNTTFSSNIGDVRNAAAWLRARRSAPALLIGHSLGGAAVLAAAGDIPECRAVATIGAPADPAHVTHLLGGAIGEIERTGCAEVSIGGRPFRIGRDFVRDLEEQDPERAIGSLRRALMVMHAPTDTIVSVENAARIFGWAKHPKSFVSLDSADHLLTKRRDSEYVADVLAAWAARYLDAPGS
jgi:alpha-beta hydrolase superfamily lysophospholipase